MGLVSPRMPALLKNASTRPSCSRAILDVALDLGVAGDVGLQRDRAAARALHRGDGLGEPGLRHVHRRDAGAFAGEPDRGGAADAPAAAGDHGHLPLEAPVHPPRLCQEPVRLER